MSNNDQTYEELLKLKQRLEERVEILRQRLEETQEQLKSVSTTLALLGHGDAGKLHEEFIFPPSQLRGLTHHQALERIAKANNGRFRMTEAKRVLVAAGLISNPKNAYSILFNTIKRVGKFKRSGPGQYELTDLDKKGLVQSATK